MVKGSPHRAAYFHVGLPNADPLRRTRTSGQQASAAGNQTGKPPVIHPVRQIAYPDFDIFLDFSFICLFCPIFAYSTRHESTNILHGFLPETGCVIIMILMILPSSRPEHGFTILSVKLSVHHFRRVHNEKRTFQNSHRPVGRRVVHGHPAHAGPFGSGLDRHLSRLYQVVVEQGR
jgi:hypothetical protein